MYPMIPKGMILLRLIPTADHTFEEVDLTIEAFKKIKQSLEEGAYNKELSEVGV
jgi:glycine C-acetyltransferase